MSNKFVAIILLAIASALYSVTPTLSQVRLGNPIIVAEGTVVNPGDVYGIATFRLTATDSELENLLKALIKDKFHDNEGSYLLTLELLRNGQAIAQKPIISLTYESDSFLFFTVSRNLKRDVAFNGVLLETEPIEQSNDDVEVVFRSYYKRNAAFDMSLFDLLDEVNKNALFAQAFDPGGLATSIFGTVKSVVAKVLSQVDQTEDIFRFGMVFAYVGVNNGGARKVTVPILYRHGNATGSVKLEVKTWSLSSRFAFDVEGRRFIEPSADSFLNNSALTINGVRTTVPEFLVKTGDDRTREFLKALFGTGFTGDIGTECTLLMTIFRRYMSNRDSLALLWGMANAHRGKFKQSRGAECIEQRKAAFTQLGLPVDDLLVFLRSN